MILDNGGKKDVEVKERKHEGHWLWLVNLKRKEYENISYR